MDDPRRFPETEEEIDSSAGENRALPPATPRWVKLFGILAVALVALFVVVMLMGGHTPPVQHMP